jgi:lysine 6-dehydrogenase
MVKITALGCGLIGHYVVERLLERGHDLSVVDINPPLPFSAEVNYIQEDALTYASSIEKQSIVLNLLPGSIGDLVRAPLLERSAIIIDLAFSAEDPDKYLEISKRTGGKMLWDIGVAPGLSNMLVAEGKRKLGDLEEVIIKVGGNPTEPDEGWSYMAPFSPSDVIEEYTRPARIVRNHKMLEVDALGDRHLIQVDGYGEMEAFLTDGLRSLLHIGGKNMAEYTVRWPGHIDKWLAEGSQMDLDDWRFDKSRKEFTWLQVKVSSADEELGWELCDEGGPDGSSMARTTGLVTAACALMAVERPELIPEGINPPEALGVQAFDYVLKYLKNHGINIKNN